VSTFLGVEDEEATREEVLITRSKEDPDVDASQAEGSFVTSSDETVRDLEDAAWPPLAARSWRGFAIVVTIGLWVLSEAVPTEVYLAC